MSATGIPKVLPGECPCGKVKLGVQAGIGKRQSPFVYCLVCVIHVECLALSMPIVGGNKEPV